MVGGAFSAEHKNMQIQGSVYPTTILCTMYVCSCCKDLVYPSGNMLYMQCIHVDPPSTYLRQSYSCVPVANDTQVHVLCSERGY